MKLGDLMNPEQYVLEILDGIIDARRNLLEDRNIIDEALAFAKRAVEKQAGIERALERLEEEGKLADEEKERCARKNPLQFDSAKGYATGIYNAIEIIKEEVG